MKNFISKHVTQAAYTTAQSTFDKPHVAMIEELLAVGNSIRYIEDSVNLVTVYVDTEEVPITAAAVGDILWSDGQVTSTVRPTSDGATPLGICVIASNDSNTNDGKARFIGLPSKLDQQLFQDAGTINDFISTSTIDGEANTAALVSYLGDNMRKSGPVYYCINYAPSGTTKGDWYLPAIDELKPFVDYRSTSPYYFGSKITTLHQTYPNDTFLYWPTTLISSTQGDRTTTFKCYNNITNSPSIVNGSSSNGRSVVPMIKTIHVAKYYYDSAKTTEIVTSDADVIYKVYDGTNITYMKWNGSAYEAATFDTKKKYIDGNTKYRWNGTALVAI